MEICRHEMEMMRLASAFEDTRHKLLIAQGCVFEQSKVAAQLSPSDSSSRESLPWLPRKLTAAPLNTMCAGVRTVVARISQWSADVQHSFPAPIGLSKFKQHKAWPICSPPADYLKLKQD